jgi:DNA-binding beta-propeller fold protein YncE
MRALRKWIGTGLLIALPAFYATAQSGSSINGPSLGFISDDKGTAIWPLLGILGAAVPGQPLALPESITNAAISPQQNYALAISTSTGQPVIIRLDTPEFTSVPLVGGRSNPGVIAISPVGTTAAFYEKSSGVLQFVSGLPAAPRIVYEVDVSSLSGDVQKIAVSDDAGLAVVLVGNESRSLWVIQRNGSLSPLSATRPSQIAFIANRSDALVADDATQEVFLLQGLDQAPARTPGIVLRDGERQFSAIAASTDGRSIYVAQQGSQDIFIVDLQTRETVSVPCHCGPTVFSPLKGNSVFRLNGLSNGPITVLDASSSNPRTLFIPIDPNVLAGHTER